MELVTNTNIDEIQLPGDGEYLPVVSIEPPKTTAEEGAFVEAQTMRLVLGIE